MQVQEALNIGDIVHLNSGSPDLKVCAVEGNQVTVNWDDEGEKRELTLPEVCFKRVTYPIRRV